MTEHTPGPWFVKGREKAPRDIHIHGQFWQTRIATTSGLRQDAIDKANADLIAAAPELLAALEAFLLPPDKLFCDYCEELAEVDNDGNITGPIRHSIGCPDPIARVVIAKATAS